jgi:hypothetical protein
MNERKTITITSPARRNLMLFPWVLMIYLQILSATGAETQSELSDSVGHGTGGSSSEAGEKADVENQQMKRREQTTWVGKATGSDPVTPAGCRRESTVEKLT